MLSILTVVIPETEKSEPTPWWIKPLMSLIILVTYGGFGLLLLKREIPKGFNIFEEEF